MALSLALHTPHPLRDEAALELLLGGTVSWKAAAAATKAVPPAVVFPDFSDLAYTGERLQGAKLAVAVARRVAKRPPPGERPWSQVSAEMPFVDIRVYMIPLRGTPAPSVGVDIDDSSGLMEHVSAYLAEVCAGLLLETGSREAVAFDWQSEDDQGQAFASAEGVVHSQPPAWRREALRLHQAGGIEAVRAFANAAGAPPLRPVGAAGPERSLGPSP